MGIASHHSCFIRAFAIRVIRNKTIKQAQAHFMKLRIYSFLSATTLVLALTLSAQIDSGTRFHRIAIFTPLYLDSAFDGSGSYRYEKNFPKFLSPGLEFYEGAQWALDSLKKEGAHLEVRLYDSRSSATSINQILQEKDFENTELILGHVSPTDLRIIANGAFHLKIPFINANFPNDGNITNNPSLIILNSTLKTHCEGIYKFLQRNYPTSSITVFRKKGALEDRLKSYFTEIERTTASVPLRLKYINLEDNIDAQQLSKYLDSNIQNICIVASLEENFAKTFCQLASQLSGSYHTSIFGMPTWDNTMDFTLPGFSGPEIFYSTPFYINPNDNLVKSIQQYFSTNYYMKGSDMVIRGFEATYHFVKLLEQFGPNLGAHIGEKKFEIINAFDIEPVYLNKQSPVPDYYENKKLYFVKKVDGKTVAVY